MIKASFRGQARLQGPRPRPAAFSLDPSAPSPSLVVNADITIVTESPRVSPWVDPMAERLAERLRISRSCVSIKGKTNEGLGWIGRGEGLAVMVVVLLDQIEDIDTLHASIRTGG